MVNKVPNRPALAKPFRMQSVFGVSNYLSTLIRSLFDILSQISFRLNNVLDIDGTTRMTGPLPFDEVATADMPPASEWEGAIVYNTDFSVFMYSDGNIWLPLSPIGAPLQEVSVESTVDDSTTSSSFTSTSLSASITPTFSNSIIRVDVFAPVDQLRVSGSPQERRADYRIRNTTDGGTVGGVRRKGQLLESASNSKATNSDDVTLTRRYTVNSTATRTFELQHATLTATDTESSIPASGARGPAVITLTELRPAP